MTTAASGSMQHTAPMPYDQLAPAQARQFVTTHMHSRSPRVCEDAMLLVSELVTNAVRYGRPDIEVRLVVTGSVVRFEVLDGGSERPLLPHEPPAAGRASGRGLLIVDAVAARWGIEPAASGATGKRVWFELDDGAA